MKIRRIHAVYWSATDTTRKIAEKIAEGLSQTLNCPADCFDFTLPEGREKELSFTEGDLVIFGTPTYAGRVPNVLLPFLRERVHGGGALAVPIVLYGNRNYDDSLIELRNLLEADGFHTIAAGAFVGEHSFSKVLAAGRPDTSDFAAAQSLADQIAKKVSLMGQAPEQPVFVRGKEPIRPYYTPRDRAGNPVDIRKVRPKVRETCNQCGLCAKLCPMGSIDPQNVQNYTGICIKCGACIKKCPQGARYIDDERYLYHQKELELGYSRRAEPELFL